MTPWRTILAALLVPAAIVAAGRVAWEAALSVWGAQDSHGAWHLARAVLIVLLALEIRRARQTLRTTGWTARRLAAAQPLAFGAAAGNTIAGIAVEPVTFPPGSLHGTANTASRCSRRFS